MSVGEFYVGLPVLLYIAVYVVVTKGHAHVHLVCMDAGGKRYATNVARLSYGLFPASEVLGAAFVPDDFNSLRNRARSKARAIMMVNNHARTLIVAVVAHSLIRPNNRIRVKRL